MKNISIHKQLICLITVVAVCLTMVCSVSAEEQISTDNGNVQTRAISGSATLTTNKRNTFNVYSEGWSLAGHAKIIVNGIPQGKTVIVQIIKPDGGNVTEAGGNVFTHDETRNQIFYVAPAGNYKVTVIPSDSFWFSVTVALNDGFA